MVAEIGKKPNLKFKNTMWASERSSKRDGEAMKKFQNDLLHVGEKGG